MSDSSNPFGNFDLERAIPLRWTLRDIKAKRFKMFPVADSDLQTLIDLGLIEDKRRTRCAGLTGLRKPSV